jgi:hypothetical protein
MQFNAGDDERYRIAGSQELDSIPEGSRGVATKTWL